MELGPQAAEMHREVGREIAQQRIDVVWGIRGHGADIVAGAAEQGLKSTRFFETAEAAAVALADEVRAGDLVLVKGSRSVETDKVISTLKQRFPLLGEDQRVLK
ncbi:MAG: UDP-N-acetylmuramoyl-tripeptide--D-alanyl-D-alanine ligase [Blastocatellia bacterium]|nr:UDP-N-acetylmuramoyl-tripeptide--D-alanyl-D-alanine ligase [Blastocatellia bacterium]